LEFEEINSRRLVCRKLHSKLVLSLFGRRNRPKSLHRLSHPVIIMSFYNNDVYTIVSIILSKNFQASYGAIGLDEMFALNKTEQRSVTPNAYA